MEEEYFTKARKWYNTLYVEVASERIIYCTLLLLVCFCLKTTFDVIGVIEKYKQHQDTYILFTDNHREDERIKISKMPLSKDNTTSILTFMLSKYVLNMETLDYDAKKQTGASAIENKIKIIKNLSSEHVYQKYLESAYKDDIGDISLAMLKKKKIATIEKIDFIYENLNIVEKIQSYISASLLPQGAKVFFSIETTDEKNKKQHFVATISFSYYAKNDKQFGSKIEFKVNDYYTEKVDNNIVVSK